MNPIIPITGYVLLSILLLLLLLLICKYQIYIETQTQTQPSPQTPELHELDNTTRISLQRGGIGRREKGWRGILPFTRGERGRGHCEVGGVERGDGDVRGGERINGSSARNRRDEIDVVDGEVEILGASPPYTGRGRYEGWVWGGGLRYGKEIRIDGL
ncbi:uncharacterized protein EAF01_009276 [Botrytis porri]|uniref:uncharacterized protein n=1 Tax=Botrytis porri TaxID=87229 RepID=UPI0018FF22B1|nr:uncharacterized protein EAF01_009276 [Botrytis porri]KAF7896873.1 hypothetical protein EAF01_009276 [Botrytis porri]